MWARYEFPHDSEPLIRPMWGGGNGAIKTDSSGAWKAEPVVFARQAYRVTAFVKARRLSAKLVCREVESKPLSIGAVSAGRIAGAIADGVTWRRAR